MNVPRATYSFSTSFWAVPETFWRATPCLSATATYIATRTAAGALIVIDVETRSRGMPPNTVSMSARESIATPTWPTSPAARSSSESRPIWVGRSNAVERPGWPWPRRNLKRSLVASGVPNPAYWRIVHGRARYMVGWIPRVNGCSPGKPRSRT
jgi:hypothetical protein